MLIRKIVSTCVLSVCLVGMGSSLAEPANAQNRRPAASAAPAIDTSVAPTITSVQTALARASTNPAYLQALERNDRGAVQEILLGLGAGAVTVGSITGSGGGGVPMINEWKITITIKLSRPAEISISFEK